MPGMNFQWPDPISLVADIIAIVGIPALVYSTRQLFVDVEKAREEAIEARRPRGISEDCVSFYDVNQKCAINLVPFKQLAAIPRVGDHVYLPGETEGERNYGGGKYEVVGTNFHYREDSDAHPFIPAKTTGIEILVRRIACN